MKLNAKVSACVTRTRPNMHCMDLSSVYQRTFDCFLRELDRGNTTLSLISKNISSLSDMLTFDFVKTCLFPA